MALVLVLGRSSGQTVSDKASVGAFGANATLDQVSSADIAANIARNADLLVADNATNLADSLEAQVEFSTLEGSYLAKPQLVPSESKTRADIINYVVQEGETLSDIAAKFNITTDTIKWANDIAGDTVSPGRNLVIPPVSGVLHTVQAGETPESIAAKYSANAQQIIAFNDAEIAGLTVGERIVVPNGTVQATRSGGRALFSRAPGGFSFGSEPLYGGNGYSYGYCTWHAANRRAAIGRPIPRNWGNAISWASLAARSGYSVTGTPSAGAVVYHRNIGGWGHVAFVEKVNPDGSLLVSDMNYPTWGAVTYRTVTPGEFGNYSFIH